MSTDKAKSVIEKALDYIEYQKEIFGDFEMTLEEVQEISQVSEETPKEVNDKPESQESIPALTLETVRTLNELRALSLEAVELKTDLEGTNLVFGVGNPEADLMIVGEAPGENEDKQGEPFVGAAGQLLTKIIEAIGFSRNDVYIANILKHRPPNNRDPKPEERERSLPYLLKQIEIINPKLILCVGKVSGTTLLGKDDTLGNMRQKFHPFMENRELMVTYHPAALLRNQNWKRPCWEDVQMLRKRYDELGGKP